MTDMIRFLAGDGKILTSSFTFKDSFYILLGAAEEGFGESVLSGAEQLSPLLPPVEDWGPTGHLKSGTVIIFYLGGSTMMVL